MEGIAKVCRGADRLLSFIVGIALILALLYGGYALWDTYQVYQAASPDASLLKYKPSLLKAEAANPTLQELIAINPDVRGWITIDDTHIDYPLLQGQDNIVYVNTDVYGQYSLAGSIFLDYRNAPDFSDFYSLTYGHHMDGGAMYGDIEKFRQKEFFDTHATGALFLPESTWEIELFACLAVDAYDTMVFNPHYETEDAEADEAYKAEFLTYLKENAEHYRDLDEEVTTKDRIIGLSTCSQAATNARTVVYGRLMEAPLAEEKTEEEAE